MNGEYARSGQLGTVNSHIMNMVDADKRNNSYFDTPYRIYSCNIIYRFWRKLPKTFFIAINTRFICLDIVCPTGAVIARWALFV